MSSSTTDRSNDASALQPSPEAQPSSTAQPRDEAPARGDARGQLGASEQAHTTPHDEANLPFVQDLLHYIDACPTPPHVVHETTARLLRAGFRRLREEDTFHLAPGDRVLIARGGSLLALRLGTEPPEDSGFRLLGAHTDSPNLRLKPDAESHKHGYGQLRVEVYGGALWHTWLDRKLGLAGRAFVREGGHPRTYLVRSEQPLLCIPNLAIHLNRNVNREGLVLKPQQHLDPLWLLQSRPSPALTTWLRQALRAQGAAEDAALLGFELSLFDHEPAACFGLECGLLSAPRLDNLASCHAALTATLASASAATATRHSVGFVLYDHEECGSQSAVGAHSDFLATNLRRISDAFPRRAAPASAAHDAASHERACRAMARSFLVSADMAHALHPNYPDRHDGSEPPRLGGGPVLKHNQNQSYATTAADAACFAAMCRALRIPVQHFSARNDLGCGSTIGPITAARLGLRTLDLGSPMLAMHSCRETASARDVPWMIAALSAFLGDAGDILFDKA